MPFKLEVTEKRAKTIVEEYELLKDKSFTRHFERIEQVVAAIEVTMDHFSFAKYRKAKYDLGDFPLKFFNKHPIPLFEEKGIRDIKEYLELLDQGDEQVTAHYEKFQRLLRTAIYWVLKKNSSYFWL